MYKLPIAVLAAALALPALAQRATGKSFADLDIDHDGRISLAEAEKDADVARAFISADRNKDGYLSVEEFGNLGQNLTPETASSLAPAGTGAAAQRSMLAMERSE